MEKNPYTMAKLGLELKENPNKRDCGFYMKYFFLFLSLIQFLIILGLVLFMVYGNSDESTKQHQELLKQQIQQSNQKVKDLSAEVGGFKRQLNASQTEAKKLRDQASRCNSTLRFCTDEKMKCLEQRRQEAIAQQVGRECTYNLYLLNITTQVRIDALQDKVTALQLRSQLEQDASSREKRNLQDQLDRAVKDKQACEIVRQEAQTRMQTYQGLGTQILAKLEPIREDTRSSAEQALSKLTGCYQLSTVRQDLRSLTDTMHEKFAALAQQVERQVSSVAEENGRLQSQKTACDLTVQDKERQAGAQKQECEREKQLLRDVHDAETKKMYLERQQMVGEKEALNLQLQQSKTACLNLKGTASFPSSTFVRPGSPALSGGTNSMGSPWNGGKVVNSAGAVSSPHIYLGRAGAVGQPNPSSPGNPSVADRLRTLENKRPSLENSKGLNQPPAVPAGQRPSG